MARSVAMLPAALKYHSSSFGIHLASTLGSQKPEIGLQMKIQASKEPRLQRHTMTVTQRVTLRILTAKTRWYCSRIWS